MARNQEKAQAMLNKYLRGKEEQERGPKKLRPFLASECTTLNEADKWHWQIVREIGKKVGEIQNAGLGEHRLRDLNDEINKLIREKGHWEKRVVELGGPDYSKARQKVTDSEGKEIAGATGKGAGYRYFGAAKNLPGVKELFEKEGPRVLRRSRYDMHKAINADYYGMRDEDDGVLVKVEMQAEARIKQKLRDEWEHAQAEKREAKRAVMSKDDDGAQDDEHQFVSYVPLPEQKEIELRVMAKKKQDLMAKYASDSLIQEQETAKQMLNVKH